MEAPTLRLPAGYQPKNVSYPHSDSDYDTSDSDESASYSLQKDRNDVIIDVLTPAVNVEDVNGETIGHWEERLNMFEKLILAKNFAEEKVRFK